MAVPYPSYDELPEEVPGYPCSWAYFNSLPQNQGQKDGVGTLNFLTPERRKQAAQEVETGQTIPLDLPVHAFQDVTAAFDNRAAPLHTILTKTPFICEDMLSFNTQSTSQWDGFRHFGIRATGQFYNGYTVADFATTDAIGVQAWTEKGSITSRGVLLDFDAWATHNNETVDPNTGRAITLTEVLSILDFQKTTIRPGDVLIFRTGWLKWYNATHQVTRHHEMCIAHAPGTHSFIGLAASRDFVAWLWNNQIAAVAGDQVAFEATPPPMAGYGWLHEHLLAGIGCPIGELWDTEELARVCKEKGRYTFFLVSVPLAVKGGVASTANAVAIF